MLFGDERFFLNVRFIRLAAASTAETLQEQDPSAVSRAWSSAMVASGCCWISIPSRS